MNASRSDIDRPSSGILFLTLWYLASLMTVMLVPSFVKLREHLWNLPADRAVQSLVLGLGFLLFALVLHLAGRVRGARGLVVAVVGIALCFALPAFLLLRSTLPVSRGLLAIGIVSAVGLAAVPHLVALPRFRWLILLALIAGAASVGVADLPKRPVSPVTIAHTEYYNVKFKLHSLPIPQSEKTRSGGGIARLGDGFLLVTGRAQFYRLRWAPGQDSLEAIRLPLVAPLNLEEFLRDQPNPSTAAVFRITDLAVDERSGTPQIYVAHRYWDGAKRCVTTRVSATTLPEVQSETGQPPAWRTIFESQPCLSLGAAAFPQVAPLEEGGALAIHPTLGLLLSLGDNGFDGLDGEKPFAQREDVSYGKVLRLDLAGGSKIISMGHRNAQGLTVAANGRIWETEHGPQGGDEVNLIEPGNNYGWPLATYGTEYGTDYWPLARTSMNHGTFSEPLYAFVPSLGISQLISIGGKRFPMWAGDLLAGSLRRQSLYRLRVRNDRLSYVETIFAGERIRDLVEGADGRILIWTDAGGVLSVSSAPTTLDGRYIFETRCAGCHEPPRGETNAAAPSLLGVVGRAVAGDRTFEYSEALRQLSGKWTGDRLDRFLENPGAYAPGTRMTIGLSDENQRRVLLDYLAKDYRGPQVREAE
jgi:cytochrome c2